MLALFTVLIFGLPVQDVSEAADLAAARAVFERNIRAIQERNREAYLACYLPTDRLLMTGAEGFRRGFRLLESGTAATGSDEWPAVLVASDLQLSWVQAGLVYGTYRYRVSDDGVAWRAGISERTFVETDDGWRIAVSSAFDAPVGTAPPPIALVGATVHDGAGGTIPDAVVVVRGGRIEAVGPRSDVEILGDVDVVELSGRHLVPGLVDTHVHYSQTGWADGRPDSTDVRAEFPYEVAMAENRAHPERYHRAFLGSGITAVLDVGGYPWTRRLGEATELDPLAPHVVAAGPLIATFDPGLDLPGQKQMVLPATPDEARALVRSHAAAGSQAIKFWFVVRDDAEVQEKAELLYAVGSEAEAAGLPLVVHATSLEAARVAVDAGATLLVHSVEDRLVDAAFVESIVARGTYYCPTLTVREGYLWLYQRKIPDELRELLDLVHPSVRDRVERTTGLQRDARTTQIVRAAGERRERELGIMNANLLRLHRAGVPVVLGTDAGNPLTLHGPSVFAELEAMAAAGLTPNEVLVAATSRAAAAMGRSEDLGRIAPGYVGDLVVVERDPGADVRNLRRITHVMRGGTLYERAHVLPR